MHFHLPKPLHGWREFAGEVGIIVIGVLIALGAEQVLEDWHWHNEVSNFRAAVDHEIGRNLDVWRIMMSVRPCVAHRLDDLGRLLAASTGGRQLHLLGPIDRPVSYSSYYSVWDDKAEDVTTIPLTGKSSVADYLVIASGRSSRQVAAMAQHLREKLKATGRRAPAVEGLERGDWVLVDAGDIVAHLFRPEVRSFYNLEKMWSVDLAPAAAASVAKRRGKAAPKAVEA